MPVGRWTKTVVGAALGLSSIGAVYAMQAGEDSATTAAAAETQRGTVEKFTKNDHDDVDGILLSNKQQIHFPPHMGDKIVAWLKVGDEIEVHGQQRTLPKGELVFEADQIKSGDKTVAIEHPAPPGPKGPKGPKGAKHGETPMHAAGKVKAYAKNPKGDVDGLILADDTIVKLPPHQGAELQKFVAVGDEVAIDGRRHETPKGDVHLHADRIVASASGKSLERDEPRHSHESAASNEEILRELREIRKLLEEKLK